MNSHVVANINRDFVGSRLEEYGVARIHELTMICGFHATVILMDLVQDLLSVTLAGLKDLYTLCIPVRRIRLNSENP